MKINLLITLSILFFSSCNQPQELFNENSEDWMAKGDANWTFFNNELIGIVEDGDGFVITKQAYKDYILELEFKPDSTINSGVFIRCNTEDFNPTDCYEINIWDLHPDQNNRTGAMVTRKEPLVYVETIGKWNTYKINAEKSHIQVWINNQLTIDTKNDDLPQGQIGLQAKGTGKVMFRNVKLKNLAEK